MKLSECIAVSGNPIAGNLLYRIHYWYTPKKLRLFKDGHKWIAKTRLQWAEETGLSFDQIKRALSWLKKKGLIIVARYKFGGQPMCHIRLADDEMVKKMRHSNGADSPSSNGVDSHHSYNTSYYRHRDTNNEKLSLGEESPISTGGGFFQKGIERMKDKLKVSDVMKLNLSKNRKVDSVSRFEFFWKEIVGEVEGSFIPSFTKEDKGKAKHILNRMPSGDKKEILTYTLRNWPRFTLEAKDKSGAFSLPSKPQLGFLLKYIDIAVELYYQNNKTTKETFTIDLPVQKNILQEKKEPSENLITGADLVKLLDREDE